jgi:uncharacterized protein YtpQ (UPF0354 family)
MWLWIVLGWCAAAVATAIVHHRLRRALDRYPPELATFLQRLENALATAHPEVTFLGLLPDRFAGLLRIHGQDTVVSLAELYRRTEQHGDDMAGLLARVVAEAEATALDRVDDVDFAAAAPLLMPQVRAVAWLAEHGRFGDSALVHTPLNTQLVTVYALDVGSSLVFVCREHLRRWRKQVADVHHLALANLERCSDRAALAAAADAGCTLRSGDGLDAARVLLLPPRDGLLVAIPDRDTLWVGSDDGQNLERLMATTAAIAEVAAHPVSAAVFRVTDGHLSPVPTPR